MSDEEPQTEWDGYSIYARVSAEIHDSVTDALDAHAYVAAVLSEGGKIGRDEAAPRKAAILSAAARFQTELRVESHRTVASGDSFEQIHGDWFGEGGYVSRLQQGTLREIGNEAWLGEFVAEIHEVAFELGYIAAGREEDVADDSPVKSAQESVDDLAQQLDPEVLNDEAPA